MFPLVTIAIPSYNQAKVIGKSIHSAMEQDFRNKEILVVDDCSKDRTAYVARCYGARVIVNEKNLGIGGNLSKCVREAKGEYIIFLCGDDLFADKNVVRDMVDIFQKYPDTGGIGRNYYQFMNGDMGAINLVRGDILTNACNPSGIGFRKSAIIGEFSNDIFIECPTMVKRIIDTGWCWDFITYDTVAARIHPGGNTATLSGYYTQSPTLNWNKLIPGYVFYPGFISLKIRRPDILLKEILITMRIKPMCLLSLKFWACVILSCLPRNILNRLNSFYRHRIGRCFCRIIGRIKEKEKPCN